MPADSPRLHLRLDDGSPVLLRPLRPEDAPLLVEGLAHLSAESRITRFFSPIDRLTPAQLDYLTRVDQHDHVAWGALDEEHGVAHGLGVARFARLADEPHVAEIAVTVIDDAQRHGLGSLLIAVLMHQARQHGVEVFRAILMAHNPRLIRRLVALGGTAERDGQEVTIDLPAFPDPDALPSSPEAEAFAEVLRSVERAFAEQSG